MKIAITGIAILALVVVSSASADHKVRDRHAPPLRLAHALHVQAHVLAEEINYHYSHSEWPHHQMNRISRLVVSLERDLASGHLYQVHRNLHHIEIMLHHLDLRLRSSVAVHDHAGARHLTANVKEMEELAESLEHSLKHVGYGDSVRLPGGQTDGDHIAARPGQYHRHR